MGTPATLECPGDESIIAFVARRLDVARNERIEQHLASCVVCRRLVSDLVRSDTLAAPEAAPETLPRGTTIGRYLIVSLLGRGGMGVVYRAYDPDLNRQVALKLVGLGQLSSGARERARQRLMREAQALAKLSHPNVVAVYDVGAVGDDVFVAMELVEGCTLRAWLADEPRSAREIMRLFRHAGDGLAAAHKVGVIHRDFKPDNVMVGRDGRVRVLDFGLARLGPAQRASRRSFPVMASAPDSSELTHAGMVMGTPAYMSPEQDAGLEAGAASDQFSFCVALYEALFGKYPHPGETYVELAQSRANGAVIAPPKLAGVTSRVRRALVGGLHPQPTARHRSLEELIGELEPRRWSSPRRLALVVAGTLVVASGATWAISRSATAAEDSCAFVAEETAKLWNPQRREHVVGVFAQHHRAEVGNEIVHRVDRWTADWGSARTQLCRQPQEQKPDLVRESKAAERLQCLERQMSTVDASLTMLTSDVGVVDRADASIVETRPVRECMTLEGNEITEQEKQDAMPIIGMVMRERMEQSSGHFDTALEFANKAVEAARTKHSGAIGIALQVRGDAQAAKGQLEEARASYRDAAIAAAEVHEDGMVADAWTATLMLAFQDHKVDDALRAAQFAAKVAVTRLDPNDARRATYHYATGSIAVIEGKLDDAIADLELAVTEWTKSDAQKHAIEIAVAQNSLGMVHTERGDWTKAKDALDRASAGLRAQSPDNPQLGMVLDNYAALELAQDHFEAAESYMTQALPVLDGKPALGTAEIAFAWVYVQWDRCEAARPHIAHGRKLVEQLHGADTPILAMTMLEEGRCMVRDNPRRAVGVLAKARAIAQQHSVAPRELPEIEFALAEALDRAGDRAHAKEHAAASRAAFLTIGAGTAARVAAIDRWLARSR
jgi:tetratricopeptide (TPR) repeat protein